MNRETFYILNPVNYTGFITNTMHFSDPEKPRTQPEINACFVDYHENKTFAEYNAEHNNELIAICWNEYFEKFLSPFHLSLQKEWKEITKEEYWEMLECLPPHKWHDLNNKLNIFYISEAYTADLHSAFIKDKRTNKYFTALRSIYAKDDVLINEFETFLKTM